MFTAIDDRIARLQETVRDNQVHIDSLVAANTEIAKQIETLMADKARLDGLIGRSEQPSDQNAGESNPQFDDIQGLPESLRPYARPVDGKNRSMSLRSAEMVADVVQTFDHPVERKAILQRFLERFPREHLELVWHGDIDGSLAVAVRRATSRGLIERTGKNLYTSPTKGEPQQP